MEETMGGTAKRTAVVPRDALSLGEMVSKADLLEAAWSLASLCNNGEGCDDEAATMRRMHEELNALRTNRGARQLPSLDDLRARWDDARTRRKAMVDGWEQGK